MYSWPGSTEKLANCGIGISEAVSIKMLIFLHCFELSGWFDHIGILYGSIYVGKHSIKLLKYTCEVPDILKCFFCCPRKLFIIFLSFFSSKPSAIMAYVGKLLWAPTSYLVFVVVHLYLGLLKHSYMYLHVSQASEISIHCKMPFYYSGL